jgi:tRNA (mo5U34)-methyltransferase
MSDKVAPCNRSTGNCLETLMMTNREQIIARAESAAENISTPAEALTAYPPYTWFHSFLLSDGTRVDAPIKSYDVLQQEFDAFFSDIDLRNLSVLDIGAWDGAFSFEANRRGAARVLATDYFAWTHPHTRALEHFLFVRRDLGLDVEYRLIDIPELSKETVGTFDVVMFFGVFYHLREPISILDRLADIADRLLILETHLDLSDVPYPAMRFYPGAELASDPTNWWGPNRACIEELLKAAGFADVRFTPHPTAPPSRYRGIFHAWK